MAKRWITIDRVPLAVLSLVCWTFLVFYVATVTNLMVRLEEHSFLSRQGHNRSNKAIPPPLSIPEVIHFLHNWILQLHDRLERLENPSALQVWDMYQTWAMQELVPWDRQYLKRMPRRRDDGSIFLSIASFRDELCPETLRQAFRQATNPMNLYVGLVQQNCYQNCKSGVLEHGKVESVDPDPDCHEIFCSSDVGQDYCSHVRLLPVNETDSLGPYGARFLASKLYGGESWYMQMDAHMIFRPDWDSVALKMMHLAPSDKPVVSHYPPGAKMDIEHHFPTGRLCGPMFHQDTVRLEGLAKYDKIPLEIPRFAPFVGAGFVVAHASFLKDVPFDPLLPWIFMGEEIIMSSRLWTAGYDIFSPTKAVVGHYYVRQHKPKFWESVSRFLRSQYEIEYLVLQRIKHQLGYPEAGRDLLKPKSVLAAVDEYTMGTQRKLSDYLSIVGIDVYSKTIRYTAWCETGQPPPGKEVYANLYVTNATDKMSP